MLTVACVWIKSPLYDSAEWVMKLRRMVDRWIGCKYFPYRFVCITTESNLDSLDWIEVVEPTVIPPKGWPLWWYKLNLFNLDADRLLYLDLDTVILKGLSPIIDFPTDFAMSPCSGIPSKGKDLNSSVMVMHMQSPTVKVIRESLEQEFPRCCKRFAGDQQWLNSLSIRIDVLPSRWISKYLPSRENARPQAETIVSLLIQGGKNQALIDAGHSWIAEYWR